MVGTITLFVILFITVLSGSFVFLVWEDTPANLPKDIKIINHTDRIESLLSEYKKDMGNDLQAYKNHIYRVLTFTQHLLGDNNTKHRDVIEAALVFHDIGLWTNSNLAYLDPSADLAKERMKNEFNAEQLELMYNIITNHHKFKPWTGPNEVIVNAVRKADMIDFSLGFVTKGVSREHIRKVHEVLPNSGFHMALMSLFPTIHGWNVFNYADIFQIFRM